MCRSCGARWMLRTSCGEFACDRKTKRVVIGGRNDTQVVPYDRDEAYAPADKF